MRKLKHTSEDNYLWITLGKGVISVGKVSVKDNIPRRNEQLQLTVEKKKENRMFLFMAK